MNRPDAPASKPLSHPIDNTDWLKAAAIILVAIDHLGYFFVENDLWWSVVGRMAAPVFFFLLGYAKTRTVPFSWIWIGVILTLLDSWNNGWSWVPPNILLNLALIRVARPHVERMLQTYGWSVFIFLVLLFVLSLPLSTELVEYGAEGWLWALFGLLQRVHADGKLTAGSGGRKVAANLNQMKLAACIVAAAIYAWQEQLEFTFAAVPFGAFVAGMCILCISLYTFQRGPSRIQPPGPMASSLSFIGRHTLEIYAIQLAVSELIVGIMPDLAP